MVLNTLIDTFDTNKSVRGKRGIALKFNLGPPDIKNVYQLILYRYVLNLNNS